MDNSYNKMKQEMKDKLACGGYPADHPNTAIRNITIFIRNSPDSIFINSARRVKQAYQEILENK